MLTLFGKGDALISLNMDHVYGPHRSHRDPPYGICMFQKDSTCVYMSQFISTCKLLAANELKVAILSALMRSNYI